MLPVCIFVVCWPLWSAMPPQWLSCLEGQAPVAAGRQVEAWPGWSAELRKDKDKLWTQGGKER